MAHLIDITSRDDQIPLLSQTENDEIEEGREVHHSINIKDTYGQAPSGSQTKKSDQILDESWLKDLGNSPINSWTIFKVNVWLRESNPDAYTPKMVSIGPYHKKHPDQLGRMEKYKQFYLRRFLQRNEGLDVGSCIYELEKLKEEAIKCYEDIEDDSQFCLMLLLDGCFVVEFIRERCGMCPEGEDMIININNGGYIWRDLMLLENQLPFFVLNKLHDMTKRDDELPLEILVCALVPLIVDFPKKTRESFIEKRRCYNSKHLLHLVHRLSCHGNRKKKSENNDDPMRHKVMPNATELSEAGVNFAKVSNINSSKDNFTSLFDIKFENGVMTIPCFEVVDHTETCLRNLIAYEQQSVDVQPKYFCNFASFMDYLIESDKDVSFLRQEGIIVNRIGEDKVVAKLFNKIGNGIVKYPDFYYKEQCNKASQHCEKWWNRVMANLIHNYFSSVWVGTSTVAASILLILTFIQTILSLTGLLSK